MTGENRPSAQMIGAPKQSIGRLRMPCQAVAMDDGPQLARRRAETSELSLSHPSAQSTVPSGWWLLPAVVVGAAIWGLIIWWLL